MAKATSVRITALKARILAYQADHDNIPAYVLAAEIGIHPSTFSEYLLGKTPFTQKNLDLICRFLSCDPNDVAGWLEFQFPE